MNESVRATGYISLDRHVVDTTNAEFELKDTGRIQKAWSAPGVEQVPSAIGPGDPSIQLVAAWWLHGTQIGHPSASGLR